MSTHGTVGSRSIGGGRKKGGRLTWLLLLLLLLAAIVLLLSLLGGGDDDDGDTAATPVTQTQQQTAPAGGTPAPTEGSSTGDLTAGGTSLLGADPGTFASVSGEEATGTRLEVLSVTKQGFFVGTEEADRTYVELGGRVGEDEQEAYEPAVGDVIDLQGEVRPAPEDPGRTLLLEAEDAAVVERQTAFVNAIEVTEVP